MLSKIKCMEILKLNKVKYDLDADYVVLNRLVKELESQAREEEEEEGTSPASTPAIHIQKDVETSDIEYQKRLEGAGHRILTPEECEEIDEQNAKEKESKNMGMALLDQLAEIAAGKAQGSKFKKEIITYDSSTVLRRIQTDPKVDITLPIERNPFDRNRSIMQKVAVVDKSGLVLRNGNPIIKEVVSVEINGVRQTYDLGIDDGRRAVATVFDVPWLYAKVLAEKFGVTIRNPKTLEVFTPPSIQQLPQKMDGSSGLYCREI